MSRTRYRIFENEYPYFMTCAIVGWLAVFTRPEAVNILFESWRYLQKNKDFKLYGSVRLVGQVVRVSVETVKLSSGCQGSVGDERV